jgi:hypothetical protein
MEIPLSNLSDRLRLPRKSKAFFFEKKKQKTFIPSPAERSEPGAKRDAAQKIKVFLLLFLQKQKILLLALAPQ